MACDKILSVLYLIFFGVEGGNNRHCGIFSLNKVPDVDFRAGGHLLYSRLSEFVFKNEEIFLLWGNLNF